jgi:hypothetical protein
LNGFYVNNAEEIANILYKPVSGTNYLPWHNWLITELEVDGNLILLLPQTSDRIH